MIPADIQNTYRKITGKSTMGLMPCRVSTTTAYVIYLEKYIIRQDSIINDEPRVSVVKVNYTTKFLKWLRSKPIKSQSLFTVQSLYEIYINSICWKEITEDTEIPKKHLKIRV